MEALWYLLYLVIYAIAIIVAYALFLAIILALGWWLIGQLLFGGLGGIL
jgi:hypothetical protein